MVPPPDCANEPYVSATTAESCVADAKPACGGSTGVSSSRCRPRSNITNNNTTHSTRHSDTMTTAAMRPADELDDDMAAVGVCCASSGAEVVSVRSTTSLRDVNVVCDAIALLLVAGCEAALLLCVGGSV